MLTRSADVAVAALTGKATPSNSMSSRARALTFATAIGEIARATERDSKYMTIIPEEYRAALVEAHVPDSAIELILYLSGTVLDGRNTPVADGVQRAIDRRPAGLRGVRAVYRRYQRLGILT